MSITITGGISFTGGGVAIVSPPSTVNAGWYQGGSTFGPILSSVQRILFATDTATATVRGPLTGETRAMSATGTSTNGWVGGGILADLNTSAVQRITYATDTATASIRGPLSSAVYKMSGTSGIA